MRRALYTISTAAIILGGLTACNNNDHGAMETKSYNDNARPIGYYSNEGMNDRTDRNGNAYRVDDNDGPLTEIMDRTGNNNNDNRIFNNNRNNNAGIMNDRNTNRVRNDGNDADLNYHGHLNDNNARVRSAGYYNNYDGKLAKKIANRASKVANVDDARVLVTKDNIIVAVDTSDNNDNNVKNDVRKAVQSLANGKNINIITDEGTFTRVRDIDNNIRNGNTRDTIDTDIKNLLDNIGDTLSRPFNNNR
ncbi:YhcN/YlaJ family sporulation lipoprotein [Ferdinandcohnia quinoae]|uniref:YhcN/YlaJ family sporulation lipoprotein n=1 Tax=Fredinandcohnia quinoae TaxID=2918902 RepID=A0AAW5EA48_9BACI|nr:YhcN/YlaJ family sporulation lipoprotein [Fredinandcohnia sp. SECRCQ15]MCH1626545.1 YhcN/YlaJ family sporulation lipoprotein [Fredinandcohnia sp. SECRCQ15]